MTQQQVSSPNIMEIAEPLIGFVPDFESPEMTSEQVNGAMAMRSTPTKTMYVWRHDTGERLEILTDLLRATLLQTDDYGRPIFSREPVPEPELPALKCRLHKDDPERHVWDAMGLKCCDKDNLRNAYQVQVHMKTRHANECEAIARYEGELQREIMVKENQENREFQNGLMATIAQFLQSQSVQVPAEAPAQVCDGLICDFGRKNAPVGSPCRIDGCDRRKPDPAE